MQGNTRKACLQRQAAKPAVSPAEGAIQTKLAINQPGDEYEQEADRVSEQVMTMPADHSVSGTLPRIQRFSGPSNGQVDAVPASVDQTLASPGRSLEPALRQDMEQRFGHDFSRVRVHSGAAAKQSARDVNAYAYTVGHNIVFDAGWFSPGTHEGRRLIAHELTHTVQQGKGSAASAERISHPRVLTEQDADRAPSNAIAGQQADVKKAANVGTLHRQPLPDVALRPPPPTARLIGSELLDGFVLNSAALTEEHKGRLAILAHTLKSLLREYPSGSVQITGHTDASGDEKFNEQLGQQRADTVSWFLLKAGVPATALVSVSAESKLRIKTDKPEPRNRRAEVRFEPEPKGRLFSSSELTLLPLPNPTTGSEGVPVPSPLAPERLCKVNPDLFFCRPGPEPSLPRGAEVASLCTSTNCSAISGDRFDKQPPDLQRVLAASFMGPATWLQLDSERRFALTSIFNRMCSYGVWCHVSTVLKIDPGEAKVADIFTVPGSTPSVHFMSPTGNMLLGALMATGRFCQATGAGASQHPGQSTLREISRSDSLHISIGPGDQFDAHIDRYSPVIEHPGSSFCPNDPSPAALGHISRELVPAIVREGACASGACTSLAPRASRYFRRVPPPLGTVSSEQNLDSPRLSPGGTLVGITLRWQAREHREAKADLSVLPVEAVTRIDRAIEEQISPDARPPSHVRVRRTEARKAVERAGPDEEAALRIARDAAENEATNYPDAHTFARELAERMEQARRNHVAWVKIDLPQYDGRDLGSRSAIATQIQRIALILRNYLPDRAAGVHTVVVIFGSDNLATREEVKLP